MYNTVSKKSVGVEALDIAGGFIFFKLADSCDMCYNMVPMGEQPLPFLFEAGEDKSDFKAPDFTKSQRKDAYAVLSLMALYNYGVPGFQACLDLCEGVF